MSVIGKRHYVAAMGDVQRAFVCDGVKDHREAIESLERAIHDLRQWSNDLENEITRKQLEQHAQHEIGRTGQ